MEIILFHCTRDHIFNIRQMTHSSSIHNRRLGTSPSFAPTMFLDSCFIMTWFPSLDCGQHLSLPSLLLTLRSDDKLSFASQVKPLHTHPLASQLSPFRKHLPWFWAPLRSYHWPAASRRHWTQGPSQTQVEWTHLNTTTCDENKLPPTTLKMIGDIVPNCLFYPYSSHPFST